MQRNGGMREERKRGSLPGESLWVRKLLANPSTPNPTDRFCLEMNSAPEAQPVWYAAQANDRASNQTETQQRLARALPGTRVSAAWCTFAHTVSTWATWQRGDERQGNVEVEGTEELQEMKGEAGKQKEDRNIWNPIPIWSTGPQKMRMSAAREHVKPNLKYNLSNGITLLCNFSPNAGEFTY